MSHDSTISRAMFGEATSPMTVPNTTSSIWSPSIPARCMSSVTTALASWRLERSR